MAKKEKKRVLEAILENITEIKKQYKKTKDIDALTEGLLAFAKEYHTYMGVGDLLLYWGEEYITKDDYPAGIIFIRIAGEYFKIIGNTTLLHLRLAEYHINNNETEIGTEHLLKLCSSIENYEESIESNELTSVWEKYKHLVKDKVPPSIPFNSPKKPLDPEKCSMSIDAIFSLQQEDILGELSVHLDELSASGNSIDLLNQSEQTFFYVDEICTNVNSGGFSEYLYYNGNHLKSAIDSLKSIGAFEMVALLEQIQSKFPKGKIPKSLKSIQNTLDSMEDKGVDFEKEDSLFYDKEEKRLIELLTEFVIKNKTNFR